MDDKTQPEPLDPEEDDELVGDDSADKSDGNDDTDEANDGAEVPA